MTNVCYRWLIVIALRYFLFSIESPFPLQPMHATFFLTHEQKLIQFEESTPHESSLSTEDVDQIRSARNS